MNAKQAKYPQLRFPEFTDPWEQRKLGDYAEILTGGTPKTSISKYWEPKQIPWMSSGEVNKKRLDRTENMISEEGFNNSSARWVKKHSVLIALAGQGKTRGTVAVNNIQLTTNQSIAAIVPNDNFYYEFIYQSLIKRYDKLRMISSGDGTRGGLNKQIVSNVAIPSPSMKEQQKIGAFFQKLDNLITLHQRKLAKLKKLKQGYLQKLFPKNGSKFPQLRFARFADAWEQRKLGKTETHFTDGNYGESYPSAKDMSDKEDGVPFLRGSDFSNGYLDSSNANYIKQEKHEELTSGHIERDDIVLAVRGSLGTLGYATKENEGWNINSQLAILRTNKSEILGTFLVQYLLGSKGQKEILSRNTGTALKQLPIKQLKEIPVPIPTILEQQKIGSFFKQLDDAIALHQRKLEKLQELKKGYLQKMFC